MNNKIIFGSLGIFLITGFGCSTASTPNINSNQAVVVNSNQANLPEGLSANQVPLSTNSTPGIPDPKISQTNNNSKGTSSTPGIPDTTKIGKTPQPQNTPRIPGIPDQETLKKQLNTPANREMMDKKPPEIDSNSSSRPNEKRKTDHNSPNQ